MKGFELILNGENTTVFQKNRILSIFIERVYLEGLIRLHFAGSDYEINESYIWKDTSLKIGDEIRISLKIVKEDATPLHIYPADKGFTPEHSNGFTPEYAHKLIAKYHQLEQVLQERTKPNPSIDAG